MHWVACHDNRVLSLACFCYFSCPFSDLAVHVYQSCVCVQAWTIPLQVITAALVVFGPEAPTTHDEMGRVAGAACNAARAQLEEDDSLRAGLTKLLLVGVSAAVVWGGVWATCVWQLGTTHSLGGWLLAALLLVWRAALWVWRLLVWRPPSWYPAQVSERVSLTLKGAGAELRQVSDRVWLASWWHKTVTAVRGCLILSEVTWEHNSGGECVRTQQQCCVEVSCTSGCHTPFVTFAL